MGRKRQKGVKRLDRNLADEISFTEEANAADLMQSALDSMNDYWGEEEKNTGKNLSHDSGDLLEIDLHGLGLTEATQRLDRLFKLQMSLDTKSIKIRIITGKGKNSGFSGPVLPAGVYDWLKQNWLQRIIKITPRPVSSGDDGSFDRGHTDLIFRCK